MPLAGFEPAVPVSEQPQLYALNARRPGLAETADHSNVFCLDFALLSAAFPHAGLTYSPVSFFPPYKIIFVLI